MNHRASVDVTGGAEPSARTDVDDEWEKEQEGFACIAADTSAGTCSGIS
jgi:hypothetical protein